MLARARLGVGVERGIFGALCCKDKFSEAGGTVIAGNSSTGSAVHRRLLIYNTSERQLSHSYLTAEDSKHSPPPSNRPADAGTAQSNSTHHIHKGNSILPVCSDDLRCGDPIRLRDCRLVGQD